MKLYIYSNTSLNRLTMGADFKWSLQGSGRLGEFEIHYNGSFEAQIKIYGSGRSVEGSVREVLLHI